jgi:hypothetical protein
MFKLLCNVAMNLLRRIYEDPTLYALQPAPGQYGIFDFYQISGTHNTTPPHNAHDASFSDQCAVGLLLKHSGQRACFEGFNLFARISQSGDFNLCL